MLRENVKRMILSVCLMLTLTAGAAVVVSAKDENTMSERKGCDYDRNSADEERTHGGCTGTVPTPEPVSILLFSAGLAGVGFVARRKLRRSE